MRAVAAEVCVQGGLLSTFAVPVSLRLAVIICVGMSLVVLKPVNVLVLFVAVWVGTVNQDWGGTISVHNSGFYIGPREGPGG